MANHKSALKRVRQTAKRRLRNRHVMTTTRTYIKRLRAAVDSGNAEEAKEALLLAVRALDRAATKGVMHRKQASRKIGRLTKAVNALSN